jgi:asparagine synthase (glutamine-hydrolysing)
MCGFAGFLTSDSSLLPNQEEVAKRMALAISHRGPDDAGAWTDDQVGIAFGHRRLAIVDLSDAGHQPMKSRSGRFVIAFNGEIYNHMKIRGELEEISGFKNLWNGHSDTETLLAGFEAWGVEVTLNKTIGMFAIALWDRDEKKLLLVRDRFGEKPLYYGWVGDGINSAFVFGSELKALRAFPGFVNPVCRESLSMYMRFTYVPAPLSIYQNIYKLEPGCILQIEGKLPPVQYVPLRPPVVKDGLSLHRWWSLSDIVQSGVKKPIVDQTEAVLMLEKHLIDAVKLQSVADVPIGAFLSGGVDSSAIVALMQHHAKLPVKTFTVGFEESEFDESPHAKLVAKHLKTDHSELFITSYEAQAVIPRLPEMYDEPFADSSQIPTHLVCKAARQHVTVALSGDAGDELFGGYNRYFWGPRIWQRVSWLPFPARQVLGNLISCIPIAGWDALSSPINALLPAKEGISLAGEKAHKLAVRLSSVRDMDELYRSLVSEWQDPAKVVKGIVPGQGPPNNALKILLNDPVPAEGVDNHQLRMMYRDSMTYLPDDILCKVDRAAMATSLETRVPFLDHRVAEFSWQLPLHMKIRGNEGKWALRQVLYKYVPRELIDRPKAGFGIPVGQWLRGPLRDWAESLLAESRLQAEGYFYPAPIRSKWAEHLSGRRDHTASLWTVLMFQAWLEAVS